MSFDYYATLGVSSDAPPEVIRAAYRVLAQKHHPDRHGQAQEAQEITARINEAYRVLSDLELRRAYDLERSSPRATAETVISKDFHRASSIVSVSGEAAGYAFTLRFVPGRIIANDLWVETRTGSRGGTNFIGPRIQHVPKQRIGVRTMRGDLFVNQTGSHIPLAVDQDVELVQAVASDNSREGIVAIVNCSIGQWFWIGSRVDAGSVVRPYGAFLLDILLYFAIVGLFAGLVWTLFVRQGGALLAAGFFIFGIPGLLRIATPILFHTADKIGKAMYEKIRSKVNY